MFLLYFLDTYINMVKEFHWMYPLTGAIYLKMQERFIQKYQR